jgi:FK506-binding nuclear protein
MAFWAVEVVPGKAFTVVPPFDLHLTQVVLPAGAADKGRSVVEAKLDDKSFAVGALKLDLQENISLDLIFEAGKSIIFSVSGKNSVQLLGYFIDDNQSHDFSDDDDMEGLGFDEEIDSEDEEDDDLDSEEDDELDAATLKGLQQKRKAEQPQVNGAKKAKVEQAPQQQKPKAEQKPQTPKGEQKAQAPKAEQKPQTPKGEQKAQQPKGEQKQQQKPQTPQQKPQTPEPKEGGTKVVQGVKIETKTIGLGNIANVGRKVHVMYTGRLENGKVFDKSKRPFSFALGAGEVIAGWDIGVAGMRVGEKRKLTIPANKGYGAAGAPPDIPRNATLIFDVELIKA